MTEKELVKALRRNMVETGSLVCLGCGHEHNCSTHGCAIMRAAVNTLESLIAERDGYKEQLAAALAENTRLAQRIQQPSKPLTVKELRKMIGQWVWVESKDVLYPNGWYRVEPQFRETISLAGVDGTIYETSIANGDSAAYHRPLGMTTKEEL